MATVPIAERRFLAAHGLLGVAVIGAAFGSAWDYLHVATHTTVYASGLGRMPFWVPIEFAGVYVAGVAGISLLGHPEPDAGSRQRFAREAALVTCVYATSAFAHRLEWLVVAACLAVIAVRFGTFRDVVRANPVPAIALVVSGPVVEAILIWAHVFRYTYASLGNIPVWLPLLYANAVPFAVRLTESALGIGSRRVPA